MSYRDAVLVRRGEGVMVSQSYDGRVSESSLTQCTGNSLSIRTLSVEEIEESRGLISRLSWRRSCVAARRIFCP